MKRTSILFTTLVATALIPFIGIAQSVGGGGATGGGLSSFKWDHSCKDGQVMYSHTRKDSSEPLVRVCRNGSYMTDDEKEKYIYSPNVCRGEGATKTKYFRNVKTDQRYKATVQCIERRWERVSDYIPLKN